MRSFLQVGSLQREWDRRLREAHSGRLGQSVLAPGLAGCDPYAAVCVPVYVSAARYAEVRGEDPAEFAFPEAPWNLCTEEQPDGCPSDPKEVILPVVLQPADAAAFVAVEGCGETKATACD
jgi:hypothetical protein